MSDDKIIPDAADEINRILDLYKKRERLFTPSKDVLKDSHKHYKHITRNYKYMSVNFVNSIENNPYRRHYKHGQTYANAITKKHRRREFMVDVGILRYIKDLNGYVYFLTNTHQTSLSILKSHVFERFIERELKLEKWEAYELPRDEIMFDVVRRIETAQLDLLYHPVPLIDKTTGSAYLPIDGGYLVGTVSFYAEVENGPTTKVVCFYKTFLSHAEVSEKRMDLLLELYRERKQLIEQKEKEYQDEQRNKY